MNPLLRALLLIFLIGLSLSCVGTDQTYSESLEELEDTGADATVNDINTSDAGSDTPQITPDAAGSDADTPDAAPNDTAPGFDMTTGDPPVLDCEGLSPCGAICLDLQSDPSNCGSCGRTCVLPNAEAACNAGTCAVGRCAQGFVDSDGAVVNGCEVEDRCTPGGACVTSCGSASTTTCVDGAEVCANPQEQCNAIDDNCNGQCDEGTLPGCRVGVHRANGNGHVYSTDLNFVSSAPYQLESPNYFHLYAEAGPNMRPVFLCRKPNGKRFLSSDTACEIGVGPERQLGFWGGAADCGAVPLYRLYQPDQGNHFYTISAPERDNARDNLGYIAEGVAGYVWRGL